MGGNAPDLPHQVLLVCGLDLIRVFPDIVHQLVPILIARPV